MVHFNCKLSHPISCITLKSSLSCISPTPFLSLLVEFDLLLIFNILFYYSLISYVTCLLSRVSECGHEGGSPMTSSGDVTFAAGPAPAKRSWPSPARRSVTWQGRERSGRDRRLRDARGWRCWSMPTWANLPNAEVTSDLSSCSCRRCLRCRLSDRGKNLKIFKLLPV